jgi:hypothetical protein
MKRSPNFSKDEDRVREAVLGIARLGGVRCARRQRGDGHNLIPFAPWAR